MNEEELEALHDAKHAHARGDVFHDPSKMKPFLLDLKNALIQREAAIDRYNHLTVQSYRALGDLYLQIEEPRAVMMHRAAYRINMVLYGGHCNGNIQGSFRQALLRKGVPESKFSLIERDLEESIRYEVEGDLLRRFGLRGAAVVEYQKAARLEEAAFGRENPDLAYLWRKIACLASIRKFRISDIDIDQMDRISGKWFRQQQKESRSTLYPMVCSAVKRGDSFYKSLLYSHAVGEYQKATTMEVGHDRRDSRSRSRSKSSRDQTTSSNNSCRQHRQTSSGDVMTELKRFLKSGGRQEPLKKKEGDNPKLMAMTAGSGETTRDASQRDDERTIRPSRTLSSRSNDSPNKKPVIAEESSRARESSRTIKNTNKIDSLVQVTGEEQKEHKQSTNGVSGAPSTNPVISRSKIHKPQRPQSGTSMYQAIRQYVDHRDPAKPKSDSQVSKLAAKTSKIAKTTKKKLKNAMFSGSFHHHRGSAHQQVNPTSELPLHSLPPSSQLRPKPKSYAYLESPAITHCASSIAESTSKLHRRAVATNTGSQLIRHLEEQQAGTEQEFDADDAENSVMTSDKSIKESFIAETAKMVQNMSMTTSVGRPSKEPVIRPNETSARSTDSRIGEASLVELMAHIQKMSTILQRQTFRLQHRLGDTPVGSEDEYRCQDATRPEAGSTKKMIPKGQKDLYQGVQQSFDECYSVLQRAFDRLDEDNLRYTQHGNEKSGALEEYRKTFTLEKVFIDQLRAGFESHLGSLTSMGHDQTSFAIERSVDVEENSLNSSPSNTWGYVGEHTHPRENVGNSNEDEFPVAHSSESDDDDDDDDEPSFAEELHL